MDSALEQVSADGSWNLDRPHDECGVFGIWNHAAPCMPLKSSRPPLRMPGTLAALAVASAGAMPRPLT